MNFKINLLPFLYFLHVSHATLGPSDKKSKKTTKSIAEKATSLETPMRINNIPILELIKKDPSVIEILKNNEVYHQNSTRKRVFNNKILGYVTPWNSKGYDHSKMFANKLDMLSPVWLQINRVGRNKYELKGTHDIDKKWMRDVKNSGDKIHPEFFPRILFENLRAEDLHAIFNNEEEIEALGKLLVKKADKYEFTGYTFEIYSQLGGYGKTQIHHLIYDLVTALHDNNKKLILVIPPPVIITQNGRGEEKVSDRFNKDDFNLLKDVVDYFSLMTYDYPSSIGAIGANAPLYWVKKNVEYLATGKKYRAKILLGLNFFGYKYEVDTFSGRLLKEPEAVVGHQLIDTLKKQKDWVIKYDRTSEEHTFFKDNHRQGKIMLNFPTLYSIYKRIELANILGTGISIWELGQGMDYFFYLL